MQRKISRISYATSFVALLLTNFKAQNTEFITTTIVVFLPLFIVLMATAGYKSSNRIKSVLVRLLSGLIVFLSGFFIIATSGIAFDCGLTTTCNQTIILGILTTISFVSLVIAKVAETRWFGKLLTKYTGGDTNSNPVLERYRAILNEKEIVRQFSSEAIDGLIKIVARDQSRLVIAQLKQNPITSKKLDDEAQHLIWHETTLAITDGYILWLAKQFEENGSIAQAYPPNLKELYKQWVASKYNSVQAGKQQDLVRALSNDSLRNENQTTLIKGLPWLVRRRLVSSSSYWINMGYRIAEFENQFRSKSSLQQREKEDLANKTKISDQLKLVGLMYKKKIPIYLAGDLGIDLLLKENPKLYESLVFIADKNSATTIIEQLEAGGFRVKKFKNPVIDFFAKEESQPVGRVVFYQQRLKPNYYYFDKDRAYRGKIESQILEVESHKLNVITPLFYMQDIGFETRDKLSFPAQTTLDSLKKLYYPDISEDSTMFKMHRKPKLKK